RPTPTSPSSASARGRPPIIRKRRSTPMTGLDRYIVVTADVEGLHHWADAPPAEGYLRHPHRHLFTVRIRMQVHHADREVEINQVARWLRSHALPTLAINDHADQAPDFGPQSCEQLAEHVAAAVQNRYGNRWIECEVLE